HLLDGDVHVRILNGSIGCGVGADARFARTETEAGSRESERRYNLFLHLPNHAPRLPSTSSLARGWTMPFPSGSSPTSVSCVSHNAALSLAGFGQPGACGYRLLQLRSR